MDAVLIVESVYVVPLYVTLVTLLYVSKYPQLILTTVGLLPAFALCQALIASNPYVGDIPVPLSPLPSNPDTFWEYIFAFLAQPNVLPQAIPATWVPCPS